ncbi:AraC family transcriptional regulator [Dysgonomonas sp. ZJ709]|uniref:helix-turn-helix domain-containing protein n=1 Tax=Dysgonomonas sp. ZJ709 TaxID=2709797 RepID=UPI0013ED1360|nr:AraC family transcriptional regulator [Dysgonomonas sp. ZJ709]
MIDKIRDVKAKTVLDHSSADSLSDKFFIFESYGKDTEGPTRAIATDYPVRLDIMIAVVCQEGSLSTNVGYSNYVIRKNDFIIIHPQKVFQVMEVSDDFKSKVICLKPGFFDFSSDQYNFNVKNMLREYLCYSLPPSKMELFSVLFCYMEDVIGDKNNIYRKQMVYNYLNILFCEISNLLIIENENNKKNVPNPSEEIFRKFMRDIETNFQKERNVGFYAQKSHLTPKYFSTVIFKLTGKHAKEWIDEYTILEAKAMLKSTYVNIQQLSYELNFATPSHFGRYFKHHTGVSPRKYRND